MLRAWLLVTVAMASVAFGRPNVTLRDDLGNSFDCAARDCLAAYRSFSGRHVAQARPRDAAMLEAALAAADAAPVPGPVALDTPGFRAAVRAATGVAFLLDDLEARPLTVTTLGRRDLGAYVERRVVFADPEIGELDGLVLEPPGRGRVAAIVGLHGHLDTPAIFAERYLGAELAAAGYLVVIPQLRAMECLGPYGPELAISEDLLLNGFTLIGLRAYETLLMAKYLRALERVDPARLGLLSHSGGSSTAELVPWFSDDFAAQVIDYRQDWRNRCGFFDTIHCETVPELFPLGTSLSDDARAPLPRLRVDYGFPAPETRAGIVAWFDEQLRGVVCPRLERSACDGDALPAVLVRRADTVCRRAREADELAGRRRTVQLQRARERWRRLARTVRQHRLSSACRRDLVLALRRAARQADLRP